MDEPEALAETVVPTMAQTIDAGDPTLLGEDPTLLGERPPRMPTAIVARGDSIGRYVVLERLGAGGMGVVYAAYDPELDRKIAIKLMLEGANQGSVTTSSETRLHREAQALAKLVHPNVVAIHDVGVLRGQVYLAMEFIDGQTFGQWRKAEGRTWREIVAMGIAAAEGLAAAHAKGLVHRDVKPDNLMIGSDGRLRVMDFGLARARTDEDIELPERGGATSSIDALSAELTAVGAVMGTPAYMPPEQLSGAEADARADQWALCATLWEGLYGQRPFAGSTLPELLANVLDGRFVTPSQAERRVPVWVRRVLERGLHIKADQRYPDLPALIEALRADPSRRRFALIGVGVVAVIVSLALTIPRVVRERAIAACEVEAAVIEESWNADTRLAIHRAMQSTDAPHATATFEKAAPWLDGWVEEWRETAVSVCHLHTVERQWGAELHARGRDCLDQARGELDALLDRLKQIDRVAVSQAVGAAARLARADECAQSEALKIRAVIDPARRGQALAIRAAFAAADSARTAGDVSGGLEQARSALARAEALGWAPLVAQGHYYVGVIEVDAGEYEAAEESLRAALAVGRDAGERSVVIRAVARLAFVVGYRRGRPDEGAVWVEFTRTQLEQYPAPLPGVEAMIHSNQAALHFVKGEYDQAIPLVRRSRELYVEEFGGVHPQVGALDSQLASAFAMKGEFASATEAALRSLETYTELFGEEHPAVARAKRKLAELMSSAGRIEEALELQKEALAITERLLGAEHPDVGSALETIGNALILAGRPRDAVPLQRRALAVRERAFGPNHADVGNSVVNLADALVDSGGAVEAEQLYHRAERIYRAARGPEYPYLGYALLGQGRALLAQGQAVSAVAPLERALRLEAPRIDRSLPGRVRFALARAVWTSGGDRTRAIELARRAEQELAESPSHAREHKEVERWLAERPAPAPELGVVTPPAGTGSSTRSP